jgi:5-methylthioadenosine/S-adenosylhomocysteine deaminase
MQETTWERLVCGGTVLTMEPGAEPITNGAVALAGGQIAAVGTSAALLENAPTIEVIDASDCIVVPGFVNTHAHLAMTLLRGLADDLPLQQWLHDHIWPAERDHMNREAVRVGTTLAAAELIRAGVTTTADMYFFADEVGAILANAGLRGVIGEGLFDFASPRCPTPDEMFACQRELIEQFTSHPLISTMVAPHSPYTVSAPLLAREAEMAEEHGIQLHIHLSETRWEVEKLLEEKQRTPVAYLADLGVLSERTVAAHCVHISPDDLELLAEFEVSVSHNPVSNLKLASGIAPVPAMLAGGVRVGLGTDGAASNNSLDLLRDGQLAALVHKGAAGDPTALPAHTVLEMLTVRGAEALGLGDRVGTLSPGTDADLICLRTDEARATPLHDPYSHMIYAARACDVRHTIVRGQLLLRDGEHLTIDLERARAQAREVAASIQSATARRPS